MFDWNKWKRNEKKPTLLDVHVVAGVSMHVGGHQTVGPEVLRVEAANAEGHQLGVLVPLLQCSTIHIFLLLLF